MNRKLSSIRKEKIALFIFDLPILLLFFILSLLHILILNIVPIKNKNDLKTVMFIVPYIGCGGVEYETSLLSSGVIRYYNLLLVVPHNFYRSFYRKNIPSKTKKSHIHGLFFEIVEKRIISHGDLLYKYLVFYIKSLKKHNNVYATLSFKSTEHFLNLDSKVDDKIICCELVNIKSDPYYTFNQFQSCYSHADHVVFQTELVRNFFDDSVKKHSSILPNPIIVSCHRQLKTKYRIVNIGRLHYQKNQELLIRSFKRFHEIHPEYTLSIYGTGPLKKELEELIKSLNLQSSVILEGRTVQIHQAIADAKFFVLSSRYEGLSNALLEAMMMGFPCISTDCEGSTDVIQNNVNGLLTPRDDEEQLFKAMIRLAENDSFRETLGRNAAKSVEHFKFENAIEKWAQMIEEA